jgi:hypothetical protein
MSIVISKTRVTPEHCDQLKNILTVFSTTKSYNKNEPPAKELLVYDEDSNDIYLPYVAAQSIYPGLTNATNTYHSISIQHQITLRDYQVPVITELTTMLIQKQVALLNIMMGRGKTIMACYLMAQIQKLTCVVVRFKYLAKQWAEALRKNTNARVWVVGDEPQPESCDVIILIDTPSRLAQIPIYIRRLVGFLVVDECQMMYNKSGIAALLAFPAGYTLYLSATHTRSTDGMHRVLMLFVGNNIITLPVTIPLDFIKLSTGMTATREQGHKGVNWSILTKSLMYNDARNSYIYYICELLLYYKIKTLVATNEKDHVTLLHDMLKPKYPAITAYYGKMTKLENSPLIIGNIAKCGVGFDEANLNPDFDGNIIQCVVLCISIGNIELLKQFAGRTFRHAKPIFIYLRDDDKNVTKHINLMNPWIASKELLCTPKNCVLSELDSALQQILKNNKDK